MSWIELWARLQVYGIIVGFIFAIIIFIIYAIMIWRSDK